MIAAAALLANSAPLLTHSADNGNGDPLFSFGVNWEVWLIVIIKVLVAFGALMVAITLMIWFERKVISDMQSRSGPNRAGPWGLLQTLADGTKLVLQGGPAARPGRLASSSSWRPTCRSSRPS